MESFRKAYGALKDSTKVGLAKVNSEFKDLDIAIVKATNHVEYPPKERHVRRIFWATSVSRPRADVGYCIHALSRRLAKTRNWIVAIKTLIVIHRTLREGDPTFREELLNYSHRGQIFQLANFKDDSSPLAWDCSAWVRTYALFLEERLECFRSIQFDIEAERLTKTTGATSKVLTLAPSRTRVLTGPELLDNLPALQVLLFRLVCCQPEGSACHNFLIQYALALVLKESFKIYCAINDGIINLVDMFFDMPRHDAVKALNIYKNAGKQAEALADFYDFCRGLDLARTFQFPILRQPPPSFLATMEEYIKEAPQVGSMSTKRQEYNGDTNEEPQKEEEPVSQEPESVAEVQNEEEQADNAQEEHGDKPVVEEPPMISTDEPADLLGLSEINPQAAAIEESNALALAIIQPGNEYPSNDLSLADIGKTSGWELALVTTPSNHTSKPQDRKLAGGFDKFLLDSLYEDDASRRQLQLQHAGYNSGYGYESAAPNPFNHHDPFAMSNAIAPPTNVQMAMLSQQEQMLHQQQLQQQNMMMMMAPHHQYQNQYSQQHQMPSYGTNSAANPFGDPFSYPQSPMPPHGNHTLI